MTRSCSVGVGELMGTGHRWNDNDRAKRKHSEKARPSTTISTINGLEFNPGFHSETPVIGRHNHDKTAVILKGVGGEHILSTTNLLGMTSKIRNAAMFVGSNL